MSNSKKTNNQVFKNDKPSIILIFASIIFILFSILLVLNSYSKLKNSCNTLFDEAFKKERQDTYDGFKKKAFDYYEKQNHVSNQATISIGKIKEKNSLEVLSVSDTWIKITDSKDDTNSTTRWVEFNATGVYVVDMSVSEFMIDNYNRKVYVKLRSPQLSFVKLGKPEVYHYNYEKVIGIADGNYDDGVKMALSDRAEAYDILTEKIENNDDNVSKAKKSAECLIKSFIKNLNPDLNLQDSDIRIEFI